MVDSAVLRFAGAVTHFSPGSHASMPTQTTSFGNVFMAGDWVKDVPHGANGLSQACLRPALAQPGEDVWPSHAFCSLHPQHELGQALSAF